MIHVLQGLFGSPSDFSFLKNDNVVLHDLYDQQLSIKLSPDDILIGYSMGGRKALELAKNVNFRLKKLVLLSSHPGIQNEDEILKRKIWEDEILSKMNQMSAPDFFNFWNNLPIFNSDLPISPIEEKRYLASKILFHDNRLSNQENYLPHIKEHANKILWVIGLKDEKYMQIAEDLLLPYDINVKGIDAGHRLFQSPHELKTLLQAEGIL